MLCPRATAYFWSNFWNISGIFCTLDPALRGKFKFQKPVWNYFVAEWATKNYHTQKYSRNLSGTWASFKIYCTLNLAFWHAKHARSYGALVHDINDAHVPKRFREYFLCGSSPLITCWKRKSNTVLPESIWNGTRATGKCEKIATTCRSEVTWYCDTSICNASGEDN